MFKLNRFLIFLSLFGYFNAKACDGWGGEQLVLKCKPIVIGGRYIYVEEKQVHRLDLEIKSKDAVIRELISRDNVNHSYLNCCTWLFSGVAIATLVFSAKQKQD